MEYDCLLGCYAVCPVENYRCIGGAYCLHHQGDCPETPVNFHEATQRNI
jgi:hypothetical protein